MTPPVLPHSAVLDEADLSRLLAELLSFHQDAILTNEAHATATSRHARDTFALGTRVSAHWCCEWVASLFRCPGAAVNGYHVGLTATNKALVPGSEHDLHSSFAIVLEDVGIFQDTVLVNHTHILRLDVAMFCRHLFHIAHRHIFFNLKLEICEARNLKVNHCVEVRIKMGVWLVRASELYRSNVA